MGIFISFFIFQLYGFPPNVGAVGTAALLNVGNSLRNILKKLGSEGYSVGGFGTFPNDGKKTEYVIFFNYYW